MGVLDLTKALIEEVVLAGGNSLVFSTLRVGAGEVTCAGL